MRVKLRRTIASVLCASLLSVAADAGAQSRRRGRVRARQYPSKVIQEETLRFPSAGEVRVRAVKQTRRVPRLEFASARTGRALRTFHLGTSDPEAFKPDAGWGDSPIDPFVRFRALDVEGLPRPLVFAVAVRPGGSDHTFETTLLGEAGRRLKVLTPEPLLTSIQGGVFVGDLGGARGRGVAVWVFLWEDEAHYAAHRYEVRLYTYDARRTSFRRAAVLRSKGKHRQGADALEELGLPRYANLLDDFPALKDYRN